MLFNMEKYKKGKVAKYMGHYTTKKYSFRFSNITEQQARDLKKIWKGAKVSRPADRIKSRRKNGIVGLVPIRKGKNYGWISLFLKRNKLTKSKCDICVSILTEYDMRTFTLPDYVRKVVHATKADITFSFISITWTPSKR